MRHAKRKQCVGRGAAAKRLPPCSDPGGMPGLLEVLDEHMQCVQALYPKAYAAIMRKLREQP